MRDDTHHLLRLRALLDSMQEVVNRLAVDAPSSDAERAIIAQAAEAAAKFQPRSRADVLRFVEALQGGDDAWLIVHSVPGEHRADAVYLAKLPAHVRRTIGI